MRLLKKRPYVQVSIRRSGDTTVYVSIEDTDKEEVEAFIQELVKDRVDPFSKGKRTGVDMAIVDGKERGKSSSISFYGPGPEEVRDLIISKLEEDESIQVNS